MGDFSLSTSRLQGKVSWHFTPFLTNSGRCYQVMVSWAAWMISLDDCWRLTKRRKIMFICFWLSSAQNLWWHLSAVLKSIKQVNLTSEEGAWMWEWNSDTSMEIQVQLKLKSKAKLWQKQWRQDASQEWYYSNSVTSPSPLFHLQLFFLCPVSTGINSSLRNAVLLIVNVEVVVEHHLIMNIFITK